MTKLQTIEAEIQTLPVEEQKALISKFAYLVTPDEDDVFELSETELAEIDDLLMNDTGSFTHDEVFGPLLEKYAPNHTS